MILGPLTANRHRSCFQLSGVSQSGSSLCDRARRPGTRGSAPRPPSLLLISLSFCWSSVGFPETSCGPGPGASTSPSRMVCLCSRCNDRDDFVILNSFLRCAPITGDGERPPDVEMINAPPRPSSFADLRVSGAEVHDSTMRPTDEVLSDLQLSAPWLGLKARRLGEATRRTPPEELCNGDFC